MPVALPVPPAGNGDPGTAISPPSPEMLNMDTEFGPPGRETARNFPSGVTFIPSRRPPGPAGNGDPGTGERAPFAAMLKTVMSKDPPALAAIRKLSSGVVANEITPTPEPPVANGEPATSVNTPVEGLTEKALTLWLPPFAT